MPRQADHQALWARHLEAIGFAGNEGQQGRRVWVRVTIKDYYIWERPESQGGLWYIADWMKITP